MLRPRGLGELFDRHGCCFLSRLKRPQLRTSAQGAHGKVKRAGAGVERQCDRFRRGPDHRPVAGRNRNPQPVVLAEAVGGVGKADLHLVAFARHQLLDLVVPVTVGEVQNGIGRACHGTVRFHIVQPDTDERRGFVDTEVEHDMGCIQNLGSLLERRTVETE